MVRVLAISGSLRTASYNRKLLRVAKGIAEKSGAEVSEYDLRDNPLPIYDGDVEEKGLPESVVNFKKAIESNDIIIISSPEYNYSIPGGLKNAIDWASRAGNSLKNKYGIIMGASTGKYGTIRMQPDLRKVLGGLWVKIPPQPQIHVSDAASAFDDAGNLKDEKIAENLKTLLQRVVQEAENKG